MKNSTLLTAGLTLLLAFVCSDTRAQDGTLDEAYSNAAAIDSEASTPYRDLDMRLRLELPAWRAQQPERTFLQQVSYDHGSRVPGSIVLKYRGLQGFVLKYLRRRYSSTWRKQIRELEKETFITDHELNKLWLQRAELTLDHRAGGRWWEREWFHSLPPEKGGIWKGAYVHTIGKTLPIISIAGFTINNEFRGKYRRVVSINLVDGDAGRIYRDPAASPVRDDALLSREIFDPDDLAALDQTLDPSTGHQLPTSADLWIGLKPQTGRWLEGVSWKFKLRPKVKIRLKTSRSTGDVRLRGQLEIFFGVKTRRKVAEIVGEVKYEPTRGEGLATLYVRLLAW